jgi:N-acylneuraminate cytidylyltransferase
MVEILAIIPARGDSKSIPRKNIKPLGGHPLIAYSVAAALEATLVDRTVVSTDDEEIADIARSYGAEVPFLRPSKYAQDDTLDLPVFQHALTWLAKQEGYQPALVVQLRPTSPFRPPGLVDGAVQVFLDHQDASSVRGIVPSKQNPYKMWQIGPDGRIVPLLETEFIEPYNMPRQDLPDTYWQTGHIDVIASKTIFKGSMSGPVIYPYLVDPRFTVDLDTPLDWKLAEWRLGTLREEIVRPPRDKRVALRGVKLVVLDFDGVMTDNRVYVNQHGEESVAAHRGDGMGISFLRKAGIEVVILSTEINPVVSTRAQKLQVPVQQGIEEKGEALKTLLADKGIPAHQVVYLGNDVNDLPCFPLVGTAAAVADAHPAVRQRADLVLEKEGGAGAVRELADLILKHD